MPALIIEPEKLKTPKDDPKKLVLCFDGTGNTFSGSNADTNVAKLLNKLDRNAPRQYHYYQTGIGTYEVNERSVNKTWLGEVQSSISKTIDQGVGTTFDAHVMAGYRFLMRYYSSGAKIYMLGFSRGAFTAKFLTRMIHTVGLLCKGNEEMVPFAYRLYQSFLRGETNEYKCKHPRDAPCLSGECESTDGITNGTSKSEEHSDEYDLAADEITAFRETFCRREQKTNAEGVECDHEIKVFFLGIWDCVNSVAVLEQNGLLPVAPLGTAEHVRHAVAVDERRVKFKAALLAQGIQGTRGPQGEDIKEVWFPGCHGDVGGGWPAARDNPFDNPDEGVTTTFWQRFKNFWTTRKPKGPCHDTHSELFQMSDIPLAWMIHEMEQIGRNESHAALSWCKPRLESFKRRFKDGKADALKSRIHDSLTFGSGTGFFSVLMWRLMEFLPIIKRWELENSKWVNVRFPLNKGSARDIPPNAVLHESLLWRLRKHKNYNPPNNHGGVNDPCLKKNGAVAEVELLESDQTDQAHNLYILTDGEDEHSDSISTASS